VKKIVKIGQYLAKIWTKYDSLLFFWATLYLYLLTYLYVGWLGGLVVKASDLSLRGRQFDSKLHHCKVA